MCREPTCQTVFDVDVKGNLFLFTLNIGNLRKPGKALIRLDDPTLRLDMSRNSSAFTGKV